MPPLKPIHCICGVVFLSDGSRVANAQVLVWQGGKEIATQRTDDHGHFAFRQSTKGKYELSIRTTDFPTAVTQVVLVHPSTKSKKEIAVNLVQTLEHCWGFSIVNTKEFEAQLNQLNPDDSE